ncbi:MAG: hypothetical protein ACLU4J_18320 [Butyricimonas paravirosa]
MSSLILSGLVYLQTLHLQLISCMHRLGGNKLDFLGGNLYLEPQTLYIALTALIAYFLIFIYRNKGLKVFRGNVFIAYAFLSFTVTKAGILAFYSRFRDNELLSLYA